MSRLSWVERGDTMSWLSSAISPHERSWECFWLVRMPKFRMRHQHGPHAWPLCMAPLMAMALFHSWPWRIPLMAMAHSIHGHGPIPFMAIAPFHLWPSPSFMAKALSLAHHITAPGKTSPYIRSRTARASTPRRFRANRLNPGIKSYWR